MDRSVANRLSPTTAFLTDPAAQSLCKALERAGHQALFVGGCVRNAVLDAPASDVDIATDALPQQVMRLAANGGYRAVPTGIDHGTVTVIVNDTPFEVTTFRKDVATDGRRAVIAFSRNVAEDARRRDFTMNALYADRHGDILDPLGGLPDAQARRVRFIEDAATRIREDYLRILRFFRFHAYYSDPDIGWDADALAGIAETVEGLDTLSAERVGAEMLKLLAAPDPIQAVSVMARTGVLARILPGADTTLLGPVVHVQALAHLPPDAITRLAALGGEDVGMRLRLSRQDQKLRDSIRDLSGSALPLAALGQEGGVAAATGAHVLRSAVQNQMVSPGDLAKIGAGAQAKFPLSAKDLPHLTGPDLGARLKALRGQWLASDLTMDKDALLQA
ncbi:MAG: CCA tRNA nucleotidyltransferase [Pseudomonadota bacterium]